MYRNDLFRLVDSYRVRMPRAEATISNWAVGHARLFQRLRNRQPVTDASYERAFQWFSDHWPSDLEWPCDIDRPTPQKAAPGQDAPDTPTPSKPTQGKDAA